MKLEYLFVDHKDRKALENCAYPERKVHRELADIKGADHWAVTFRTDGDSPDDADLLSDIHEQITARFRPIVVTNESSAYYNQMLYPLFNGFERKLRKLLYFKSALNHAESSEKNIGCLEEQDLGSIFDMLFTDTDFITAARQRINEKAWKYTKKEILETLSGIPENVLWDDLIGPDCIPTLRKEFYQVRLYRNDTMHAHNMNKDAFRKAKALITAINAELDAEIEGAIGRNRDQKQTDTDRRFNIGLAAALNTLMKRGQTEEYERLRQTFTDGLTAFNSLIPPHNRG